LEAAAVAAAAAAVTARGRLLRKPSEFAIAAAGAPGVLRHVDSSAAMALVRAPDDAEEEVRGVVAWVAGS
jgi:hypothetical protein